MLCCCLKLESWYMCLWASRRKKKRKNDNIIDKLAFGFDVTLSGREKFVVVHVSPFSSSFQCQFNEHYSTHHTQNWYNIIRPSHWTSSRLARCQLKNAPASPRLLNIDRMTKKSMKNTLPFFFRLQPKNGEKFSFPSHIHISAHVYQTLNLQLFFLIFLSHFHFLSLLPLEFALPDIILVIVAEHTQSSSSVISELNPSPKELRFIVVRSRSRHTQHVAYDDTNLRWGVESRAKKRVIENPTRRKQFLAIWLIHNFSVSQFIFHPYTFFHLRKVCEVWSWLKFSFTRWDHVMRRWYKF